MGLRIDSKVYIGARHPISFGRELTPQYLLGTQREHIQKINGAVGQFRQTEYLSKLFVSIKKDSIMRANAGRNSYVVKCPFESSKKSLRGFFEPNHVERDESTCG